MPLFDFRCDQCADVFEVLVRGSDKPACPSCNSAEITKLLGVPAAHTQGGSSSLPVCNTPAPSPSSCQPGGCGQPWCGSN